MHLAPIRPLDERHLRATIDGCSARDIIALVHAKVVTVQGRRDFEDARRTLSRDGLVSLAAETLSAISTLRARSAGPSAPRVEAAKACARRVVQSEH